MASFRSRSIDMGIVIGLAVVLVAPFFLMGCSGEAKQQVDRPRSEDLTPGEFPDPYPPVAEAPPPPMLREPKAAVYSYLRWISYAYRILNSDVATHAFSVYEEVRVNSYVELNRQRGQALDQRLTQFEIKDTRTEGATATVSVVESWAYRYIDIKTAKYKGEPHSVTYDSTYTVVDTPGSGWLVDSVVATPRGEEPQ